MSRHPSPRPTALLRAPAILLAVTLVGAAGTAEARYSGDAPPRIDEDARATQKRAKMKHKRRKTPKKRINIDVQDADVVDVIRLFGDVSGENVVVGDDVTGKVTLKLKNVPWDEALDVVLATKGLGMKRHGSVIRVAPKSVLDAEQDATLSRQLSCEQYGPLETKLIPVRYADATSMANVVKGTLSARGSVSVDKRTNTLIVRDVNCP